MSFIGRSWKAVTAHAALNTCSFPCVAGRIRSVKNDASMKMPMHGTNRFKNLSRASPSPGDLCTAEESGLSSLNSSAIAFSVTSSVVSSAVFSVVSSSGGLVCFKHFRHSWSLNTLFDLSTV